MSSDKKPVDKRPAFRTDFQRFTRTLLYINLLGLVLGLIVLVQDLWEGQMVEALKRLPLLLVFMANAWMNRQALKNKKHS